MHCIISKVPDPGGCQLQFTHAWPVRFVSSVLIMLLSMNLMSTCPGWDMGAINAGRTLVLRTVGAELNSAGVSFTNDFVGAAPSARAPPCEA